MSQTPPPPPSRPPAKAFDPMDVLGDSAPTRSHPLTRQEFVAEEYDRERGSSPSQQHAFPPGPYICGDCGLRTVGRKYMPGSILFEIAAWCLILWPIAIYYSWYRRRASNRECPKCKGRDLVRG